VFEDYISEKEYADARGVTVRTLQRERKIERSAPFIKVGRDIMYKKSSIIEWFNSQERK
jgi:hypothetical protein